MLRPPRHRAAAAPPCPISAGMFRPIPSSNRRRAHPHLVAVRAGAPRAPRRPLQARQQAPRVLAVQPRLRQLVRVACKTADATNSDREATPYRWLFVCPHLFISASPANRESNPSSQGELELYCLLYSLDSRNSSASASTVAAVSSIRRIMKTGVRADNAARGPCCSSAALSP